MLTLCGFAASNYHNKVKFALLEKGVPFEEELAWVGATDASASPLGKVPYLKTEQGAMCESAVMLEYIEQKYPQNPLLPASSYFQREPFVLQESIVYEGQSAVAGPTSYWFVHTLGSVVSAAIAARSASISRIFTMPPTWVDRN